MNKRLVCRLMLWVTAFPILCNSVLHAGQLQIPVADKKNESESAKVPVTVPRLVGFNGVLNDRNYRPLSGVVGVAFALYKYQQGGPPLWMEIQNVQLDDQGRYHVLLGVTQSEGLPTELFVSGESRWLGVQTQLPGEEEKPRVLLVSVPYALKAADADTLGGKPLSSFMLVESRSKDLQPGGSQKKSSSTSGGDVETFAVTQTGTSGYLAKYVNSTDLGQSAIIEDGGSGNVGIGTTTPSYPLNVKRSSFTSTTVGNNILLRLESNGLNADSSIQFSDGVANSAQFGMQGGAFYITSNGAESFRIAASRNVGIGTTNPNQLLELSGGNLGIGRINSTNFSRYIGLGGAAGEIVEGVSGGAQIKFNSASNNDNSIQFLTHRAGQSHGVRMTIDRDGNVGVGTASPTVKLDVQGGQINASGGLCIGGVCQTSGSALSSAAARGIVYLAGCDTCSVLADTDDQKTIYFNAIGPMTIQEVRCFSDAGTPLINIQRDDGSPANILSADLQCTTSGNATTGFQAGENILNLNDKLDFVVVTAGGAAHRVTVSIKATVN